jgi:predicted RNA polymerase sigma factor
VITRDSAASNDTLIRRELCEEAIRLRRVLAALMPHSAEARGLLALMLLHDSRREARLNTAGELVLLDEHDRTRWNQGKIHDGIKILDEALILNDPGPYQVQAACADLLRRTNQREAAAEAYQRALDLCGNRAERAYLQRQLDEMLRPSRV